MHFQKNEKTATKWLKEAQKGHIRIALLILLNKKPRHGYEMMKEVEDRTDGFWRPTAGGVYPILQSLEKAGYIKGEWGFQKRRRKIYSITEEGKLILDRALFKQRKIADSMNALFEEYSRDVLELEPEAGEMMRMPNPFSRFLEEGPTNKREALELKRKRIQNMINMMQDNLKTVDNRLAKLSKEKKPAK